VKAIDVFEGDFAGSVELQSRKMDMTLSGGLKAPIDRAPVKVWGGQLTIAVPRGSVTLYSSRVFHRGSANRSARTRTFCFLTVCEPDSAAPAGLIHTMERRDVGAWLVGPRGLQRRSAEPT